MDIFWKAVVKKWSLLPKINTKIQVNFPHYCFLDERKHHAEAYSTDASSKVLVLVYLTLSFVYF